MQTTATRDLVARYKAALGLTSDYAVAKRLGVTPQAVHHWQHGKTMNANNARMIAEELQLDVLAVVAAVSAEGATTERERLGWEKYCARVYVAAVVALAVGHGFYEAPALATTANATTYTLCVALAWAVIALGQIAFRRRRVQWLRPLAH